MAAQRAGERADEAYRRAQSDFAQVDQGYGGTVIINGQPYRTGRDSNWGSDVGGAILGGIIGSILSGGGRRRVSVETAEEASAEEASAEEAGGGGGGGRSRGGGW